MRCTILAAATLVTAVLAAPEVSLGKKLAKRAPECMSDADAAQVAANFEGLIANYSDDLADEALSVNFSDYAASVNELINGGCSDGPVPLDAPTFATLEEFKVGQGSQPPIPFELLKLYHNCDTVIMHWRSAQTPQQITGNIVHETVYEDGAWKIETTYSEFNSGAWLVDLGVFVPTCPAPPPPSRRL